MSSQDEQNAVRLALHGIEHPVIVELGAHVGEEAPWINELLPRRYVMVEPDPENCVVIRRKYSVTEQPAYYAQRLREGAIASYTGTIEFHRAVNRVSVNHASGSTHRPTGHLIHFPEVEFYPKLITVKCFTLDDLAAIEHLDKDFGYDHIDLLWCDIQGAERDMIEGGRATLAKTRYAMIEAEPEVELYEGQALKPELIAMLPGWEIIKDFGYNLLMKNREYK